MHLALNTVQMKNVDLYMMESMRIPSILLMENAANGVFHEIHKRVSPCVVHVYCGIGNNGGDGLATARILLANGYHVYVIVAGEPDKMTPDTATNFAMFKDMPKHVRCINSINELDEWHLPEPEVIIDALIGIGLKREINGLYADLINRINEFEYAHRVSVDIPSGVSADTGEIFGIAVKADVTVTFQHPKIGLYLYPGRAYTGEIEIIKIGVDADCEELKRAHVGVITKDEQKLQLPRRHSNAHKGDFGKLLVIGGSDGMAGAPIMSVQAASRAGVGLITLASIQEVVRAAQISVPQATCKILPTNKGTISKTALNNINQLLDGITAIAIGPGLGNTEDTRAIVATLLTDYDIPKIFDADAINALSGQKVLLEHKVGNIIFTPHPAEFARLIEKDISDILSDPIRFAIDFARQYGIILILKGASTIVAVPQGNAFIICAGTPGMAKGGSGDVLTGVIAGLAAQGIPATRSSYIGVMIAAMAGEAAAKKFGEYSMTPLDEIAEIGAATEYWQKYAPLPDPAVNKKPVKLNCKVSETIPDIATTHTTVTHIEEPKQPINQNKEVIDINENSSNSIHDVTENIEIIDQSDQTKKVTFGEKIKTIFSEKNESKYLHDNMQSATVQTQAVKTAEQAIAEIEEAEARGKNQDLKREGIREIIEVDENEDPKRPPTNTGRRRIG